MLISICIPTYNRALLLDRSLDSIIKEFLDYDIEIIISDNASSDNTQEVVSGYQEEYSFIKYFRNATNLGLDENAVICIKKAIGKYVFMFSDDDILLHGCAKEIMQVINELNPNFMYLNYKNFGEKSNVVFHWDKVKDLENIIYKNGYKMVLELYPTHFSAMIYKRDEVLKYISSLEQYRDCGYDRGYATSTLAHHILLESKPPFVFIGRCCAEVEFPTNKRDYNLIQVYCIDIIKHCQNLRCNRLINSFQLNQIVNKHVLWHTTKLIVLAKGTNKLTKNECKLIWDHCNGFWLSYFCVFPSLVLPNIILKYILGIVLKYRRLSVENE
jgi:glycosyltransferase involved in cell wall biosynthesis